MTDYRYSFELSEEIARWAFEIKTKNTDWFVAFSNPTAGPWKRVMAIDKASNREGEVHRFGREDERPDIILVNDNISLILILEAKEKLNQLISKSQVDKSVDVFLTLSSILKEKSDNNYWGDRTKYINVLGILWGSEQETSKKDIDNAFRVYRDSLVKNLKEINPTPTNICTDILVGVESIKNKKEEISIKIHVSNIYAEIYPKFTGKHLLEKLAVLN